MKVSIRGPWLVLPLVVMSMSLQQCSCSEVIAPLFVSEADEERLGGEFDAQLRAQSDSFPIFKPSNAAERALETYLDSLFQIVHDRVPAEDRPGYYNNFKFTIIDKDVENAFAVPGGYVYLYTGILSSMKSEAEVMGVLGHEMAHVTRHHYRDALAQQVGISVLVDAVTGEGGELTRFVGNFFGQMAALKVSRENESEADQYGTIYLGKTKRHPMGIADFFSRMAGRGLSWFSTHPDPGDRTKAVQDQVNASTELSALMRDELKYASRFEGVMRAAGYWSNTP
ncbi:MAG: M48 family metalloprotease [Fibrobacteria bacterium]|nr:M48 family metalloprotease [Fibrobacteria bacterium]